MKKMTFKLLLSASLITASCAAIPLYALADTPFNSGMNYSSIAKAIEVAVGKVLIYPMEQFASVIKYTFDTRANQASITTQSRYPQIPYSQIATQQNTQIIAAEMADLSKQDPTNAQAVLAQTNSPEICVPGLANHKCYSAVSAQNFLSTTQYSADQQSQAAQFVQTASGSYMLLPPPDANWDKKDRNVISYDAFYKTMAAIQSISENNLSYSYSIRTAANGNPSELALQQSIMTGDATNPAFWSQINRVPVVGQLVTIANYMPAIAVGIAQENKYLEMINNSLAAMLVQQNIIVQSAVGQNLYQAAAHPEIAKAMQGLNVQ